LTQVGVTPLDGQGLCTRYPNAGFGNIDCDGRSDPPFLNPPRFTDGSPEDADALLPAINGITNRNFERERLGSAGLGLTATNALVRTNFNGDPIPFSPSGLALLPLAPVAALRRRYARRLKQARQP
jgi:hypothetical protein